jgi:hypothetical protein
VGARRTPREGIAGADAEEGRTGGEALVALAGRGGMEASEPNPVALLELTGRLGIAPGGGLPRPTGESTAAAAAAETLLKDGLGGATMEEAVSVFCGASCSESELCEARARLSRIPLEARVPPRSRDACRICARKGEADDAVGLGTASAALEGVCDAEGCEPCAGKGSGAGATP